MEEDERDGELNFTITATGITQLPPEVIRFRRDGQTEEQRILLGRPDRANVIDISFNQDVNVSHSDFTFTNLTTGSSVFVPAQAFSYDSTNFTVTWDVSNFLPPLFPSGLYEVSASRFDIRATSDNRPLVNNVSEQVLVALPGDANLDGKVDVLGDAFALVGNLGTTSGAAWRMGDFNGDGAVDVLNDAFALVGNLGKTLIPASSTTFALPLGTSESPLAGQPTPTFIDATSDDDEENAKANLASVDVVFAGEQELLILS